SIRLGMGGFGLVRDEARLVLVEQLGDAAAQIVVERLLGADIVEDLAVRGFGEGIEAGLELAAELDVDIVEVALGAGEDDQNLLFERQGLVLALLEDLDEAAAAVELVLGGLVEVGAELGEGGERAVLSELEAEAAGDRLHRLGLRVAADAADRDADVDGRADVGVEEVGLEEDLA